MLPNLHKIAKICKLARYSFQNIESGPRLRPQLTPYIIVAKGKYSCLESETVKINRKRVIFSYANYPLIICIGDFPH
jgi:hypothetical protein